MLFVLSLEEKSKESKLKSLCKVLCSVTGCTGSWWWPVIIITQAQNNISNVFSRMHLLTMPSKEGAGCGQRTPPQPFPASSPIQALRPLLPPSLLQESRASRHRRMSLLGWTRLCSSPATSRANTMLMRNTGASGAKQDAGPCPAKPRAPARPSRTATREASWSP